MKKNIILFLLIHLNFTIYCQIDTHIDKAISPYIPIDIYIMDSLNSDTVYLATFVKEQLIEIQKKFSNIKNNKFKCQKDSFNYEIGRFKKELINYSFKLPENYIVVKKKGKWIYSVNGKKIYKYHTGWNYVFSSNKKNFIVN